MWESNQERTKYVSHAICLFQQKKICVQMKKNLFFACLSKASLILLRPQVGFSTSACEVNTNQTKPTLYQTRNYFKFQIFSSPNEITGPKKAFRNWLDGILSWMEVFSDLISDFFPHAQRMASRDKSSYFLLINLKEN